MKNFHATLPLLPAVILLIAGVQATVPDDATTERTRQIVTQYLESNHTDLSMMAAEVVFVNTATGERHVGVEEIREMLHFVYHVAFEAHAETRNLVVDGNRAVLEAEIVGTHIGEFAGVAATNKSVRIPLVVVYDVEDEQIAEGRIYVQVPAFLAQVR